MTRFWRLMLLSDLGLSPALNCAARNPVRLCIALHSCGPWPRGHFYLRQDRAISTPFHQSMFAVSDVPHIVYSIVVRHEDFNTMTFSSSAWSQHGAAICSPQRNQEPMCMSLVGTCGSWDCDWEVSSGFWFCSVCRLRCVGSPSMRTPKPKFGRSLYKV